MKIGFISILLLAFLLPCTAQQMAAEAETAEAAAEADARSTNIVYIEGVRYYVHTIDKGDTLYALSKRYDVSVKEILELNPEAQGIVKVGQNIKIPYIIEEAEIIAHTVVELEEQEQSDEEVVASESEETTEAESEEVEEVDFGFGVTTDLLAKIEEAKAKEEQMAKEEAEARLAREEMMRETFDVHTIESGETLYSVSRRYAISVTTLMQDNPTVDPSRLAIGQRLNIRKEEQGLTERYDTLAQLDEYRQRLNMVTPKGMTHHLVASGESVEDIAKSYDMSRREVERLNNLERGADLSIGTIILVRSAEQSATASDMGDDGGESDSAMTISMIEALAADETLEIALLLPLSIRDYAMKPFVEFYQGFLLGLEDLKRGGRNVKLNIFNTERNLESMERIIDDPAYERSNLIVGPVYEEFLYVILTDAENRRVPVVSPLVDLKQTDSPVLFQMAPAPAKRYDKLDDLFGFERHVTMIYGETNDSLYVREVRDIMSKYNRQEVSYKYRYEHPSQISERERVAAERLRQVEEEAELWGITLDNRALDSLVCAPSPSDLTPLICNEAVSNLFFVMSDNETEVDRILSALASAYTAQVAMNAGSGRRMSEVLNFSVVANPAWRNYKNIDRSIFFRDRVYNFPSYFASRDKESVRLFDGRYAEAFSDFASQYAYRGYDAAVIFGEGMYGDIESNMSGREYTPLQTTYKFEREEGSERWINTNWMRVLYNLDYTLKID